MEKTCETCKHDCNGLNSEVCMKCFLATIDGAHFDNWQPKEGVQDDD